MRNLALHQIGPVALRVLVHPQHYHVYDVYDHTGNLLAKNIRSGASIIDILDTHEKTLVGKIIGMDQLELSEENLKRLLYKPEWEALFQTGLDQREGADTAHYLWLADLAD